MNIKMRSRNIIKSKEADQMKEEKSIVLKAVETKTTIQKDHQETLIPTVIDVDPDLRNK